MTFFPDNNNLSYMGRIDFTDPRKPLFIYPGSMVSFKFTGTFLSVKLKNQPMSDYSAFGAVIDGVQEKIELVQDKEERIYTLAENLTDEVHTAVIFKRQAGHHYFRLLEINTKGELLPPDNTKRLKLEVYGDSVSAGEVTEAIYHTAHIDPDNHKNMYDNSWFSYPLMLGRKLNAYVHNVSQGGIALFDKTGFFCGPDKENLVGMETVYDKLSFVPYSEEGMTQWDFSQYIPDIVIFAIGQNDPNPDPEAIKAPGYTDKWKKRYKEMVRDIQGKYPGVKIILLLTVLMHDPLWDKLLDEIAQELNDPDIVRYRFRRCGKATPGHPKLPEQEEMAGELDHFIRKWLNITDEYLPG